MTKVYKTICLLASMVLFAGGCVVVPPNTEIPLDKTITLSPAPSESSSVVSPAVILTQEPELIFSLQVNIMPLRDSAILFSQSPSDGEWHDLGFIDLSSSGYFCLTCSASAHLAQNEFETPWFSSPAWSPDGMSLAFVFLFGPKHSILIRHEDLTIYELLSETESWYDDLSWSPDSKYLSFSKNVGSTKSICYLSLLEFNSAVGEIKCISPEKVNINPTWMPGGKKILFSSGGGFYTPGAPQMDLYTWDIETGAIMRLYSTPESEFIARYSPDGSKMAVITRDNATDIYSLYLSNESGEIDPILGTGDVRDFDWSPDGRQIVFTEMAPNQVEDCEINCPYMMLLKLIDLETGTITLLIDGMQWIGDPAWQP